jgi:flagellar biosynthesis protein FlhB
LIKIIEGDRPSLNFKKSDRLLQVTRKYGYSTGFEITRSTIVCVFYRFLAIIALKRDDKNITNAFPLVVYQF